VDLEARGAIHRLLAELADSGTAIVLVSSEFEELLALCDRIAVLSAGRLITTVERDSPDWTTEFLLHAAFHEHLTTRGTAER
jgi:ribose transport system ATP-binding protein